MTDTPNENAPAPSQENQKIHFHMACAELTFMNEKQETGITRVNVLIQTHDGNMTIPVLGRAQQGAQIQLFSKLGGDPVNVLSCVFIGISHLGKMTQADFDGGALNVDAGQPQSVN